MDWQERTRLLIGQTGLDKLSRSRVAVFGLGGVGSFAAEALARSGVGRLLLIDYDHVAPSNINRQIHALSNTVGRLKIDLMAERISLINPGALLDLRAEKYTTGSGPAFLEPAPDFVLDAIDDVKAKVDLLAFCVVRGIPVVSAMGAGKKLNPAGFRVADISATSVCPLARVVRRLLRQKGITSGIPVVFSTEQPIGAASCPGGCGPVAEDAECPAKPLPGSISFVPPVAGLIMAGFAVNRLLEVTND
ncbi:MAG: tRNA threonylcarbamoyladenosine dehydratase [Bacillota bacterium]|jgi:tRNA A37 threonylcarbamoyladenosine dehydratase